MYITGRQKADALRIAKQKEWIKLDPEDHDLYNIRWSRNSKGYWKNSRLNITLHKIVARRLWPDYIGQADHINEIKSDCQRSNLRKATNSQNVAAQGKRIHSGSLPKGVVFKKNKFEVSLVLNYKRIYLGRYNFVEEAAMAYNVGAAKYFGEFASFNPVNMG